MDSSTNNSNYDYDVVLIGCGHAHVHVLKMLGHMMHSNNSNTLKRTTRKHHDKKRSVQYTMISSHMTTPYSGMLPGYIAGHYPRKEQIHLNVIQLCRYANVRFIHASVDRITYNSSTATGREGAGSGLVYMTTTSTETGHNERPPIRYDCLSINIGCVPLPLHKSIQQKQHQPMNPDTGTNTSNQQQASNNDTTGMNTTEDATTTRKTNPTIIPVKPIADLCQYWDTIVAEFQHFLTTKLDNNDDPYKIAVIGGGMGGIELALSIHYKLQILCSNVNIDTVQDAVLFQVVLITRGATILDSNTTNNRVRKKLLRVLNERKVQLVCNANVYDVRLLEEIPDDHKLNHFQTNSTDQSGAASEPQSSLSSFNVRKRRQILFSTKAAEKSSLTVTASQPKPIVVDVCLSCVTGGAPSWLSTSTPFTTTGIELGNYIRVHPTYESISHTGIFAAGDCCHMDLYPRPKSGVFAVRAGPILYQNIIRYVENEKKLIYHRPQSTYLSIISTGNQYAIATKGKFFCIEGQYLWNVKDYIDQKWMDKYSTDIPDLEEVMKRKLYRRNMWNIFQGSSDKTSQSERRENDTDNADDLQSQQHSVMRCGGCGAKVGATIVSRVLQQIYDRQVQRANMYDLLSPNPIDHDDTAVTTLPVIKTSSNSSGGGTLIQTIDYFRSMITDPYIFGKIVAVHALSDIHAMGIVSSDTSNVQLSALVLAVVPFSTNDSVTESTLYQLLCGVSDVIQDENVQLVGGHTCEGIELACGLSITGYIPPEVNGFPDSVSKYIWRKRGGRVGDHIIITKPIGTGALFAAEMQAMAQGEHVQEAIQCMLQSNYTASHLAREFCSNHKNDTVHACTDVTGFGLIGHLLEMLIANETGNNDSQLDRIGAVLDLERIPFYRGGVDAASKGIYSSLQPQNQRNRRAIANHFDIHHQIQYKLLFDPQTAGGLMFFVDPKYSKDFVSFLVNVGNVQHTTIIGTVEAYITNMNGSIEVTEQHHIAPISSDLDVGESPLCIVNNNTNELKGGGTTSTFPKASTENRIRIDNF